MNTPKTIYFMLLIAAGMLLSSCSDKPASEAIIGGWQLDYATYEFSKGNQVTGRNLHSDEFTGTYAFSDAETIVLTLTYGGHEPITEKYHFVFKHGQSQLEIRHLDTDPPSGADTFQRRK